MKKLVVIFLSVAAVLLAALPTHSSPLRHEVISVRLEGYVGIRPESAPIEVHWTVSVKGEPYGLFVTKLRVLTGNIAYYDIFNALEPYRPALTIVGDDEVVDRFATAPAGQKIAAIGVLELAGGARYFMISSVDYLGGPLDHPKTPAAEDGPT